MSGQAGIVFGKKKRKARVAIQTAEAHAQIAAVRARVTPLPKAIDALHAAETQLGLPYSISSCRCSAAPCWARDCSGLIYFAINRVSGTNICGSSFSLAAVASDHGTEISEQEAIWTPGALGIRCAFCDPNVNGSNGHVVFMKGDGQSTVEEGGHATGCYRGHATGRGFDFWCKYPGFDYSTAPIVQRELDMFAQVQHYAPSGKPTGPAQPPQGHETNDPVVRVSSDGSCIEAVWGASIADDQPADPTHPFLLRRWYPAIPLPAGARFTGVAFRDVTVAQPRPGGVATVTDGTTRRFYLS